MTVLSGLQHMNIQSRVEIHVIGAEFAECDCALTKFEEILHWLPKIEELVVVLIG